MFEKAKEFLKKDVKDVFKKGEKEMSNQELLKQIETKINGYKKSTNKMNVLNEIEDLIKKIKVIDKKEEVYKKLKQIYSKFYEINKKKTTNDLSQKQQKVLNLIQEKISNLKKELEINNETIDLSKDESENKDESEKETKMQQLKSQPLDNQIKEIKTTTQLSNCNDDIKEIKKEIQAINHKIEFQSKIDLTPIKNKIYDVEKEVKKIKIPDNYVKKLDFIDKIDDMEDEIKSSISQIAKTFPQIPKDYVKNNDFFAFNDGLNKKIDLNKTILETNEKNINDIKYQTRDIEKDLEELKEDFETIPAKINTLDEKLDKVIQITSKTSKNDDITKEEKAFVNLADFMKKGIDEFEKVALEYSKNIAKIENLENLEKEYKNNIQKEKQKAFEEGKNQGRIDLIKDIFQAFPTAFMEIKSLFDEVNEKFKENEEIEVTNENQNHYLPYLEGEIENGKYIIIKPAILLNNEVLKKAEVKIVVEETIENSSKDLEVEKKVQNGD